MNKLQALQAIQPFDQKDIFVFTRDDMAKLFPDDKPKTMNLLIQNDRSQIGHCALQQKVS